MFQSNQFQNQAQEADLNNDQESSVQEIPLVLAPGLVDINSPINYGTRIGEKLYWNGSS